MLQTVYEPVGNVVHTLHFPPSLLNHTEDGRTLDRHVQGVAVLSCEAETNGAETDCIVLSPPVFRDADIQRMLESAGATA